MTTNRDPSDALSAAIYTALSAAHSVEVFDHVPQGQAKPYIEIGAVAVSEWGEKSADGTECQIEVHHYTEGRGRKDCKDLQRITYDTLHHMSLTVTGNNVVLLMFLSSECERLDDGKTYQGTSRFKALLESTE